MTLSSEISTMQLDELEHRLMDDSITTIEINEAFQKACELGYKDFVSLFLKDKRIDPKLPSIQALNYAIYPGITSSFGLQQAAYCGHLDIVNILLEDNRSDPSAGNFRCIKLIIGKAEKSDDYKQILKRLTDYCWDNYIDYKKDIEINLSNKIDEILNSDFCASLITGSPSH